MELERVLVILLRLTAVFLKDFVTGIPRIGKEKYEKLCSEYDQMMESGMSELEKSFESEMEFEINDVLRKQNLDALDKRENLWYFNSTGSGMIMQSKNETGEYEQPVRDVNVGTGGSTEQYEKPLALNQIDHHDSRSKFKQILATIESNISGVKKEPKKSDEINRSSSPSKSENRKVRKSCQDMIKDIYERLRKRIELRKNVPSKESKFITEKKF
ncbi:uncharacterized protein LOC141852607 [Brevipalpus obovatus]|uniref:uncharacterized protein LOC141852599 n=1 Tax=Brevipalpus obovatus TaxID=246614 RepID=UPI003D9EA707